MPLEQKTKKHLEAMVAKLIDNVSVSLDETGYRYFLKVEHENNVRPLIIELFLDDFNSAVINYYKTRYFYSLESNLKYRICAELAHNNIYPKISVSEEMINEKGDWYGPDIANCFIVNFDSDMTEAVADGFKILLDNVEKILKIDISLKLEPINKFKEEASNIYSHYLKKSNFTEGAASVSSLQLLKAAAFCKILELEKKKQFEITAIRQAMDDKIYYLANQLHNDLFNKIKLPNELISIMEMYTSQVARPSTPGPSVVSMPDGSPSFDDYTVAFSLADEDHTYVDQVFKELKKISPDLNIFYYRAEEQETKLWGNNLFEYLQRIYRDYSKHVIIFISKDYIKKRWSRHEWHAVQEAILDRNDEYLLPARFDNSDLPGLPNTKSYVDLSTKTPQKFAQMIINKVA